jgi:hypothetical protein
VAVIARQAVDLAGGDTGSDQLIVRAAVLASVVLCLAALWLWWAFLRRKRLIQDLPTSPARAVALGLHEVAGVARSDHTVASPQSGYDCVWWKNTFYVEDGDNGWRKTGERQGGPISFDLVDDSGSIPIRPRHAEVSAPKVHDGPYMPPVATSHDPNPTLVTRYIAAQTSKKRRVVEHVIKAGDEVYVLGTAQLPHDQLEVYIGPDRADGETFMIRVGAEVDALFAERVGVTAAGIAALASAAGGGIAWADGQALAADTIQWSQIGWRSPVACAVVCLAIMGAAALVFVYNGLMRLRQRADAAWALIDVQLRRRHDLIPNLVEVAGEHARHEHSVQTAVAQLRSSAAETLPKSPTDEAVGAADAAIRAETVALDRALAVIEAHPTINADASFGKLRAELVDTEDRIAMAREFYNTSVLVLHDRASTFPGNVVAWVFELTLDREFANDLRGRSTPAVAAVLDPPPGAEATPA